MNLYDNTTVRRQDRLLDEPTAMELLRTGEYGILSMIEDRQGQPAPYAIPISYAWDGDRSIYFHCAPEGHKLACAAANPQVSFVVVGPTQVIARQFTTAYQSVVVRGMLERGLPEPERMEALALLVAKYAPHDIELGKTYAQKSFHRTEILRLTIEHLSGKAKQTKP